MPLTDRDYDDILHELANTLNELGLAPLADRVFQEIRKEEAPYTRLLAGLRIIAAEISFGSKSGYVSVLHELQKNLGNHGRDVTGIEVELSERETAFLNRKIIRLSELPNTDRFATDLYQLIEEIAQDRDHPV